MYLTLYVAKKLQIAVASQRGRPTVPGQFLSTVVLVHVTHLHAPPAVFLQ